jgi:predicted GTPase
VSASGPRSVSEPYKRYLLNAFRKALPFREVPIRLLLRGRGADKPADE